MKEDSLIRRQDISIREKKAGVVPEIKKENRSYHINDSVTRLFEFKNISLQIIPPNHLSISQLFF